MVPKPPANPVRDGLISSKMVKNSLLFLLALAILSGCVTHKSRQDQSKVAEFWHNMNSHFNGWFNANELVEKSIATLEAQHQDNFNDILPIYPYAAVENADAVKADLDEAIKKVSVVVTLHEFSDWADDCYLLIGKSLYLKKDYEAAENAFEFYMDEFKPNGKRTSIKAKKGKVSSAAKKSGGRSSAEVKEANKRQKELARARKKAEKERKAYNKTLRKRKKKGKPTDDLVRPGTTKAPDGTTTVVTPEEKKYEPTKAEIREKLRQEGEQSGLLLRESVYDDAILWLAKTYVERENWTSADYQLRRLEGDDILPKTVYEELPVARAYYHLQRHNYPQVIPFLEQAIERASRGVDRARYSYIIAQLHLRAGDVAKAREWYERCLKYNGEYEMELNTELNIIRTGVKEGRIAVADAMAQLQRMLRDPKNDPYEGRIYYLMAQLARDGGDIAAAIGYLEQSVEALGNDPFQATETHYMLAKLSLQLPDYIRADAAFKACAAVIKQGDPRYKEVKKFAENLTDIAANLTIIQRQDSLLSLSTKSEAELKELAREIKLQKQKEAEAAEAKAKMVGNGDTKNTPINPAAASGPGGIPGIANPGGVPAAVFWAFDTKNLRKTRREFDRIWGDIPLTDFWGVSAKAIQFTATEEDLPAEAEGQVTVYKSELEDLFKDVPKTDSARTICHNKIRQAMLLLGGLYRDRLEDFKASIDVLETLLARYPDAPEELETYYQLYLSSLSAGDRDREEKYKALILAEYPNSRFAKVLSDPAFAAKQQSELDKLNTFYNETYGLFRAGEHALVLERLRGIEDKFGVNNLLMPKFDLLKAMSLGATLGQEAYVDALKYVVSRYPNTDEQRKANDMLLLLGQGTTGKAYGESGLESAKFTLEDNALHFVVVYVSNQDEVSLNDTKVALAEFHTQFFKLDNLKMASLVFDPAKNNSLVLVRSFATKDKAMLYYQTALRNPKSFLPAKAKYEVYPITQKNYREVIKSRSLEEYRTFFEKNYLNK